MEFRIAGVIAGIADNCWIAVMGAFDRISIILLVIDGVIWSESVWITAGGAVFMSILPVPWTVRYCFRPSCDSLIEPLKISEVIPFTSTSSPMVLNGAFLHGYGFSSDW